MKKLIIVVLLAGLVFGGLTVTAQAQTTTDNTQLLQAIVTFLQQHPDFLRLLMQLFSHTTPPTPIPVYPPGCTSSYGFSSTTGQSCSPSPIPPPVPNPGYAPNVSVIGQPTFALQYDSQSHESALVSDLMIQVQANQSPIYLTNGSFSSYLIASICGAPSPKWNCGGGVINITATPLNGASFNLPANSTATYEVKGTYSPAQMFAGTYYATAKGVYYGTTPGTQSPFAYFPTPPMSNTVTIIGERSPYITGVQVTSQSFPQLITIAVNSIRVWDPDGSPTTLNLYNQSGTVVDSQIFYPTNTVWVGLKEAGLPSGFYSVLLKNATGASNNFGFQVGGTTGNLPPVISGVSGPTTLAIGQTGTWTVRASDPENGPLSYSVRWGDEYYTGSGNVQTVAPTTQTATFTHSYANAGIYKVGFTVADSAGQVAQTFISVNVGGTDGCANGAMYNSITGAPCPPTTPSITVTSPNGGETWRPLESHQISWTTGYSSTPVPATDHIRIDLEGTRYGLASGQSMNSAYVDINVPTDVPSGSYRIKITDTDNSNIFGYSNYFTITSGTIAHGACGSAQGMSSVTQPTANLCSVGNVYNQRIGPNSVNWLWDCAVANPNDANDVIGCWAPITPPPPPSCPGPYHVLNSAGSCVWSCGTGTTPNTFTNQCSCQSGLTQTGTDSFGRRTCS